MLPDQHDYDLMCEVDDETTLTSEPNFYITIALCILLLYSFTNNVGYIFLGTATFLFPFYLLYQLTRMYFIRPTAKVWRSMKLAMWGVTILLGFTAAPILKDTIWRFY